MAAASAASGRRELCRSCGGGGSPTQGGLLCRAAFDALESRVTVRGSRECGDEVPAAAPALAFSQRARLTLRTAFRTVQSALVARQRGVYNYRVIWRLYLFFRISRLPRVRLPPRSQRGHAPLHPTWPYRPGPLTGPHATPNELRKQAGVAHAGSTVTRPTPL